MKACFIHSSLVFKTTFICHVLINTLIVQAQADTAECYFPAKVGMSWIYKIYPQYSNGRERITITKDSISSIDGSHFVFVNDSNNPEYRVDSLGNVFKSNQLIFMQRAKKFEAWASSDSSKTIYRIKDIGYDYVFQKRVKFKIVEWGSKSFPDTFGMSRRSDYYSNGFGLYFAIVEPSATERSLIGFISNGDTLGDITKIVELKELQISSFILHQNYPNPFNSSTIIQYELRQDQIVSIKIYDLLGRELQRLINEKQTAGLHSIHFDASELQSGIYLLQFMVEDRLQVIKLLCLK